MGLGQTVSGTISSSLLNRVRANDQQAWQTLSNLYGPLIYSWCRQQGLQPSDAGDAMQEVFVAVAGSIDRFRRDQPGSSFRGWLWTITRNKIRDHYRHLPTFGGAGGTDAQQRLLDIPDVEPDSQDQLPEGRAENSLLARSTELVRAHFEPKTWQAFWRTAIDELPTADVAAELGMSVGAVRKAKFRVLRALREAMEDLI